MEEQFQARATKPNRALERVENMQAKYYCKLNLTYTLMSLFFSSEKNKDFKDFPVSPV